MQHVSTEEGRARLESGTWKFDYFLKDYLGNERMMLADNGTVLEETHYYPFGLIQKGISMQALNGTPANRKKYNGYEQNNDFDLNLYESFYRTHDPQLGKFWQIDPKPNHTISLYATMDNNPIRYNDLLGDTAILGIKNSAAAGLGHQVLIFQDKNQKWFVYSMGAAPGEKGQDLVSGRTGKGEVTLLPLTQKNFKGLPEGPLTSGQITEFLAGNKLDNTKLSDPVVIATTQKQDETIATNATKSKADFASGKEKYSIYSNNSTHATMGALNTNTGLELPVTGGPKSTQAQVRETIKVRNMTPEQRASYFKEQRGYIEKLKHDAANAAFN